jgi:hypothetical protein
LFSDSVLTFALVVLSTAVGIFGLYILPTAGLSLLLVASIGGLRLLLSYVRAPVGQHQDAREGALTVAMVSAHVEADQRVDPPQTRLDEAISAAMPLFTVNLMGGYRTPNGGSRRVDGSPDPFEWFPPTTGEQTCEIPAVAHTS